MRTSYVLVSAVWIIGACSGSRFDGSGDPGAATDVSNDDVSPESGFSTSGRLEVSAPGGNPPFGPEATREGESADSISVPTSDSSITSASVQSPADDGVAVASDDGSTADDDLPVPIRTSTGLQCGNGIVETGEECDGDAACSVECQTIECGNARVDEGEECDPAQEASASCSATCRSIECGNRRVDSGEECEPPNSGMCDSECALIACGNGRVDEGEECDGDGDDCSSDCELIACGNGRIDPGEGCEPPGSPGCDAQCRPVNCGNDRLDEGEECDPPVTGSCDGQCLLIECGNGRLDEGEGCEPPGSAQCDASCRLIVCGDGRIDVGEECDPPTWGYCNVACERIICGDGRLDEGEQCDPGIVGTAQCSSTCSSIDVDTGTEYLYTFDADTQQWFLYAASPERLFDVSEVRYDAQNGDISPGVLRLSAPFDSSNQKIEAQVTFSQPRDFRGRTLRARVRLGLGLSSDSADPGGIKLFAKAGDDYDYASGPWTHLTSAQGWVDVSLDMDAPILLPSGSFDAAQVREIGVELRVFNETDQVAPAVVYLDSISY